MVAIDDTPKAQYAGGTHLGQKRRSNEDSYLIADLRSLLRVCESSSETLDGKSLAATPSAQLLIIADGMGGYAHGEDASRVAVKGMADYMVNQMPRFLTEDSRNSEAFTAALRNGPIQVHRLLQQQGRSDPAKAQMGTTLTASYIVWPFLYLIHVGDSRCYLCRDGNLKQLTTDHTVAQYLLDAGEWTRDSPPQGNLQHMLWNSVSASDSAPKPQVWKEMLQAGDYVLLCSDGLTRYLFDEDITKILTAPVPLTAKISRFIDEANRRGGRDNITVIVADFKGRPDTAQFCGNTEKSERLLVSCDTDPEVPVSA